jgi:N4-gp56 family major capsid protein
MQSFHQIIQIDQIAHSVRNKGELAEQKSVVRFREHAKDRLAYWLANRMDQLVFLTLSGLGYQFKNNGALRPANSPFPRLAFAGDVTPPTAKRSVMWDGNQLLPSVTANVATSFVPNYRMIVDICAYAKEHYMKPLMARGKEYYVLLVHPTALAMLKKDPDYQRAVITALPRELQNPWFSGATVTVDGIVIHDHRLVYNTKGAAPGSKWGAGGNVNGTRSLLCGAQALGFIDLDTARGRWTEKYFDYDNIFGINVAKIWGCMKPKFYSIYDQSVEDFGVLAIDHYIQ